MKIRPSALAHAYNPGCILRACGADATTFLQGQFTNDLSKLPPGGSAYGLWLDRRGRVLADSQVVRAPEGAGLWIVSLGSSATLVAGHLNEHIIADEVEIADETSGWRGAAVVGAGIGEWLSSAPRCGFVFPGRRGGAAWEWIYPLASAAEVDSALAGLEFVGIAEMERRRIAAGIPAVPADIGPSDLPNEAGLDQVAISYSKGCYLGQEVMARVKALGRVRRQLVRVRGTGPLPGLPTPLWQGERKEGELRSAVAVPGGFEGLALLAVARAVPGEALAVTAGGPATVIVAPAH